MAILNAFKENEALSILLDIAIAAGKGSAVRGNVIKLLFKLSRLEEESNSLFDLVPMEVSTTCFFFSSSPMLLTIMRAVLFVGMFSQVLLNMVKEEEIGSEVKGLVLGLMANFSFDENATKMFSDTLLNVSARLFCVLLTRNVY